ncbi:NADH-ubiquinone oxidoreductase-F iron-sulfur binding region domain-containing protein [Arthrobacter sp. AQ5-05]|uniref:NADH-ubiquinone oxidoreductase-F iron-sulfur binding region domain-containing protein n=1 Tax=Arthrobacter sp. AQ5-05 TaxID=2184581 RepID=UPI00256FF05E|nr:NADH-ubiquinone oxidoreductase-F iron-sulfur binding region domain-containing protein [Arthrobacter sp. AQ5-05]
MTHMTSQMPVPAQHLVPSGNNRLFAAGSRATLACHEQAYGPLPLHGIDGNFVGVLEQSGLTGRGGAAFASWRKFSATGQGRRGALLQGRPVVIANGAEGEPLSFKDKTLLIHAPHLVLDGLLVAARSVSASSLYVYTTAVAMPAVEAAIAERLDARRIQVIEAPETFVSGQASAVVNAIGGGNALPLDNRRRLSESGLKGRPTLVLNVETLAHVALIARYGAHWFRSAGSDRDPGTRLVSVSGRGADQILEVAGDEGLGSVLAHAGIDLPGVQAVLVGGYHGRWVKPLDYRLTPSGQAGQSVRPGAGVLHVLSTGQCGLEATAWIVEYLAGQSAKQCGPCMFGLPAMSKVLAAIAGGDRDPQLVGELERLGNLVARRGACHHPDGTLQLIHSALEIFAEDVRAHLTGNCTRMSGRPS